MEMSIDWTVKDNMVNGLFLYAGPTRGGYERHIVPGPDRCRGPEKLNYA